MLLDFVGIDVPTVRWRGSSRVMLAGNWADSDRQDSTQIDRPSILGCGCCRWLGCCYGAIGRWFSVVSVCCGSDDIPHGHSSLVATTVHPFSVTYSLGIFGQLLWSDSSWVSARHCLLESMAATAGTLGVVIATVRPTLIIQVVSVLSWCHEMFLWDGPGPS